MKSPRMIVPAILAVALLLVLALFSPQQLPVVVYKLALVILAGTAGYWLDRALFPYARPHDVKAGPLPARDAPDTFPFRTCVLLYITAQARRTVIVAACMLAVGLGL